MNLIEFIGFIITMVAFFFLIVKQAWEQKRRREHPEQFEEEFQDQQTQIKEILDTLNLPGPKEVVQKKKALPPPPPAPQELSTFDQEEQIIEERREKARQEALKDLALIHPKTKGPLFRDIHKKDVALEIQEVTNHQLDFIMRGLGDTHSLKQAFLLKEVLGSPKGLKVSDDRF